MRIFVALILAIAVLSCSTPGPEKEQARCQAPDRQDGASAEHWNTFQVRTAGSFAVQGTASGKFQVSGSLVCFAIDKLTLSRNPTYDKPLHITAVKFGLGLQLHGDEWKILGMSGPHDIDADAPSQSAPTLSLAPLATQMATPENLSPGAFVYMEIELSVPGITARVAAVPAKETVESWNARINPGH